MRLNSLKALLVSALVLIVFSSSIPLLAVSAEGTFYINGKWRPGVLSGGSICINSDGTITATPPAVLKCEDGTTLSSPNDGITVPYSGRGKTIATSSSEIADINIFVRDGLNIESREAIDMFIYDMSGKCVYNSNGTNALVDGNILNTDGNYTLRLTDEAGEIKTINFMFVNDSFSIKE